MHEFVSNQKCEMAEKMVVLLRRLYEFEYKPALYINKTELIKIKNELITENEDLLSLFIIDKNKLSNIEWSKIDIHSQVFITLPYRQQERVFKYVALDILLHQPSTIIDGIAARHLFALFEIPYEQFKSYLQTKISQNAIEDSLNYGALSLEQINQLVMLLKEQYIASLDQGVYQRLLLYSANHNNSSLANKFINYDIYQICESAKFYLQYLWSNRLNLFGSFLNL